MKKILFSNKPFKSSVDFASLILRIGFGCLIMFNHGWMKLSSFDQMNGKFMEFMGLSSSTSLTMAIFAEFFCAFLLIMGLFSRLATIPLIITMIIALKVKNFQIFGANNNELALLFLIGFISIFLLGSGKYSLDGMIYKKK